MEQLTEQITLERWSLYFWETAVDVAATTDETNKLVEVDF